MKIVIMGGTLRSGNRGVNALTRGTIEALVRQYNVSSIKVLRIVRELDYTDSIYANNQRITVDEVTCSAYKLILLTVFCLIKNFIFADLLVKYLRQDKFLKHIYEADSVLDISEGDSFSDIYGKKRFIVHSFNKLAVLFLGKKLTLLPQTIGPFNNSIVRHVAKYILSKADQVLTRDELSYKLCCEDSFFNIDQSKVFIVPDMAFFMDPATNVDIDSIVSKIKRKPGSLLIGLNVSGLLYNGGYTKNNMFNLKSDYKSLMYKIINEVVNIHQASVLLVPHVIAYGREIIEDDLSVCKKIFEEFNNVYPDKITYVDRPFREHELKQIIGCCDFFIGARMHACIGAISMEVPTVPIAYSRKFVGVWKMFGLDEYVADPRTQTENDIMLVLRKALTNKEIIKLKLRDEMLIVRGKILAKVGNF